MPLNIALLGAGRIGQVHARAVASVPGAALAAVFDPFAEAAERIRDAYGCAIMDLDAIVASDDVDAVIIGTPTDTHADLIETFARAGKQIFCEKPIDLSLARVRDCLKVVEDTGATLMVGFNRRFDPDFKALKDAVASGSIGRTEMITITSRDPGPPPLDYIRRSGGIFRDMTIHDFDIARWLLDEEVETVQAAASVLVDPEIGRAGDYDSINVILRTSSGTQATITNSRRAAYGYDQRIEVHGSEGAASVGNVHSSRTEIATQAGYTRPPLEDFFMSRYKDAYAIEIAAFVKAVADGTAPPTTGHDGMMALALADAAVRSVDEARVVRMTEVLG